MNKSFRIFSTIQKLNLAKIINGTVRTIRRIPFIGKHLGDKYSFFEFKEVIYAFYPIFSIFKQVIKSAFSMLVPLFLDLIVFSILINIDAFTNLIGYKPSSMIELNNYLAAKLIIPIFYLSRALFQDLIGGNIGSINEYLNTFYMEPKSLFKSFLYYDPALRFFGRSLVFALFFSLFGEIPIYVSLLMSAAIYCLDLAASIFRLKVSLRDKKSIFENGIFQLILIFLINFVGAFVVLSLDISPLGLSLGAFILSFVGLIIGLSYMKNFKSYAYVIEKSNREFQISLDKTNTNTLDSVKIDDKNIGKEKVKGEGFFYLNNLFFLRHNKLIKKPILIKSIIVLVLGIGLFLAITFFPNTKKSDALTAIMSFLPILMYIICKQDIIIRSMYLNCDQGLMPYGFYRENKNLLAMFKTRLNSLLKIMTIPCICLILSFVLISYALGNVKVILIIAGSVFIILMGLFFTALPLMQYYIFQPFDQEGKQVGKVSKFINFALYYVCFFLLPSFAYKVGVYKFMGIIGAFSLVFVGLTLFLVYKIGHKTFKIRN